MFSLLNHNVNNLLNQRTVKPIMSTMFPITLAKKSCNFLGHLNIPIVFSAYAERLLRKWHSANDICLLCHWLNCWTGWFALFICELAPATGFMLNPQSLCPYCFVSSRCSSLKSSKGWLYVLIHVSAQMSASL